MKAKYSGSQAELYLACQFGWELCETHIAAFAAYKSKYTPAYIQSMYAEIAAANALDDAASRYTTAQNWRLEVLEKKDEFLYLFNALTGYITDAYRKEKATNMIKSAGQTYYAKANRGNWASLTALINAAVPFVTTYAAELSDNNNMPVDFPTKMQTKKNEFEATYKAWNAADTAAASQTEEKTAANNELYNNLSTMIADASKVFLKNDPILSKFTISSIYSQIRGVKTAGISGTITNSDTEKAIAHATVSLVSENKRLVTTTDGRFEFTPLPSGIYTLKIEAAGYQTVIVEQIEVKTGVVSRKNVKMLAVAPAAIAEPVA